ncbi:MULTISPECIES: NADH-quinone oxidoreductase subunit C [unclassified Adlercreutzia]|uniref:NADH-quinone oxidoreductase subunit C n=1 Tax=unclassified Adlercreutzia TaxID=2636013 RepID=UPI0013EDB50A|nr:MULTISPECIES: NADH-quinone oxidoreductase subunit C [unclassified Adlercreutzia]
MPQFKQDFSPLSIEAIHEVAAARKSEGYRYVQTLAVNTEDGVDLVYSFMKDGALDNEVVSGVPRDAVIPSITDVFLEAFVFENEIHDLFGVHFEGIAIDFGGNFYHLSVKEPMTIISPEQKAARDKARKIAAAKAAKEAKAKKAAEQAGAQEAPAQAAEAATAAAAGAAEDAAAKEAELEAKLANMDPEKAAKVRAAMEAKAKKAAAAERKGE